MQGKETFVRTKAALMTAAFLVASWVLLDGLIFGVVALTKREMEQQEKRLRVIVNEELDKRSQQP